MENQKEYEKRYQAIRLYKKGHRFNKILQLVQRSRGWLYKWLSRPARIGTGGYKEYGNKGLRDRSRAPTCPNRYRRGRTGDSPDAPFCFFWDRRRSYPLGTRSEKDSEYSIYSYHCTNSFPVWKNGQQTRAEEKW